MTLQRAVQPSVLFDEVEGFTRVVNPDQIYDPTDALVVAYPTCFEDVRLFRDILADGVRAAAAVAAAVAPDPAVEDETADPAEEPAIEQATAAPGETRGSRRRK